MGKSADDFTALSFCQYKNCALTFFAVSLPPNAKMHLQLSLPVPGNSEVWLQVHLFLRIGLRRAKAPLLAHSAG